MIINAVLRLYHVLLHPGGRVRRLTYWATAVLVTGAFLGLQPLVETLFGRWIAAASYVVFYWIAFCLMAQRCHDIGRSAWWLLLLPVPILGIIWALLVLGFRRGDPGENQYGPDPRPAPPAYAVVEAVQ